MISSFTASANVSRSELGLLIERFDVTVSLICVVSGTLFAVIVASVTRLGVVAKSCSVVCAIDDAPAAVVSTTFRIFSKRAV